jgi:hypothetical protein
VIQLIQSWPTENALETTLLYIRLYPNVIDTFCQTLGVPVRTAVDDNSIRTKNCWIHQEIKLQLPICDCDFTLRLYSPTSQHHIRFELGLFYTEVIDNTDVFKHIQTTSLIVLMFQYLY